MIFGINTTSDISNSLYIRNLWQFWNITSGIYAEYHVQIKLLFVYTTTPKRFVIFTCRSFKLSWNITALSQSDSRNFPWGSITDVIQKIEKMLNNTHITTQKWISNGFRNSKTLFTWSGGPRSSGVGFFCFVFPRAWKQKKPTPLHRGPPLHVNRV